MGWWNGARNGASLQTEETGFVWGDGPADILDDALLRIREEFKQTWNREPTNGEVRAGLEFSLMGAPDDKPMGDE